MMMTRSFLAIVGCIASAVSTHAQDQICSCSPTIFTFVLDFSNNDNGCEVDGNPGIKFARCIQEEAPLSRQPASDDPTRRLLRDGERNEDEPRNLQTVDIVEVVSAQFLEFDPAKCFEINQDNTYITTSLKDGDTMQFYSVSSMLNPSVPLEEQTNLVTGGASLIMYGKTESGKVYRNLVTWTYELNNCVMENNPVQVDDRIGWVKVGPVERAWPVFCPALRTNAPTLTPSASPTKYYHPPEYKFKSSGYGGGGTYAYNGYGNPNQAYVYYQPGYYNQGYNYNGYHQGYNQGHGYNGNQVYMQPQPQQGWGNDAWGSSGPRTGQASYGGSRNRGQGGYNPYHNSYSGNQGYRSSQQGYGGGYGNNRYGGQGNTYNTYSQGYSNQGYAHPQQSNPNYYNQYNHQRNGGYRRLAKKSVDKALKNEAEDAAES